MLRELPYRAGVIKDDTEYDSRGYAIDSDKIRFVRGRPQAMGGWVTKLTGIQGYGRAAHEWVSIEGSPFCAIGTHTKLYVRSGDRLIDITPERHAASLPADPVATTDDSADVVVTDTNHQSIIGDTVYLRGLTAVGGIQIGGLSGTLPGSSFVSTINSRVVKVLHTAHGMVDNDLAYFTGATTFAAITDAELNRAAGHRVKVINADSYQIEVEDYADSSSTGGGTPGFAYTKAYLVKDVPAGGNTIVITAGNVATSTATGGGSDGESSYDISIGNRSKRGTGGGYGSGKYGAGPYGRSGSGVVVTIPLALRQWSMDHFGERLCAAIVNGPIYIWGGIQSRRAEILPNAPTRVLAIIVTPQRYLMACGCTDAAGDFNPLLVRHSDQELIDVWTPAVDNSAGDFLLSAGSTVVGALTRERGPIIWTDSAIYSVRSVALADQVYDRDLIGDSCGLIAINAAVVRDGIAYWITPTHQFYSYAGGKPQPVECPLQQWFTDRLAAVQEGKIVAFADPGFEAIQWHFASGEATENNEYLRIDLAEQRRDAQSGWSHGTWDRQVWAAGFSFPGKKPMAVDSNGVLYEHETGYAADGEPIARSISYGPVEAAPANGEAGSHRAHMSRVVVDIDCGEPFTLEVNAREYPRGPKRTKAVVVTPAAKKCDVRISGRQIGLVIAPSITTKWRLGVTRGDVSDGPLR